MRLTWFEIAWIRLLIRYSIFFFQFRCMNVCFVVFKLGFLLITTYKRWWHLWFSSCVWMGQHVKPIKWTNLMTKTSRDIQTKENERRSVSCMKRKKNAGIHRIDSISAYIRYGFVEIDCQYEHSYRLVQSEKNLNQKNIQATAAASK